MPGNGLHRVQRGRAYAVVGGDTYHVDVLHSALTQPVGQRGALFVGAFEAALGGAVRAFEEDGVDLAAGDGGGEVRVELAAFASGYAVDGEAVLEVRVFGEVAARIDVMIAGSHDVLIVTLRTVLHQVRDGRGDPRTSRDGHAASLTEVFLHIHDDQASARHEHLQIGATGKNPSGILPMLAEYRRRFLTSYVERMIFGSEAACTPSWRRAPGVARTHLSEPPLWAVGAVGRPALGGESVCVRFVEQLSQY